jgi:hypothetical protein
MRRKIISFLFLTFGLAMISLDARANSFSFSGTSFVDAEDMTNIVTGGSLSLITQAPGGPLTIGIFTPGTTAPFMYTVQMYSALTGGTASVVFENQSTDLVLGATLFRGTFTAPVVANNTNFSVSFPVSMLGNLVAYADLGSGVEGPELFALGFKGSGIMTLTGESINGLDYVNNELAVSYTGTASTSTVP